MTNESKDEQKKASAVEVQDEQLDAASGGTSASVHLNMGNPSATPAPAVPPSAPISRNSIKTP